MSDEDISERLVDAVMNVVKEFGMTGAAKVLASIAAEMVRDQERAMTFSAICPPPNQRRLDLN